MAETLDYANPKPSAELPSEASWHVIRRCWIVPAAGGVLILLAYAITRMQWIPFAGLFWLVIGGLVSTHGVICGMVYTYKAACAGFREPADRRRAALAVVLPISNFPLAIACFVLGARLMSLFGDFPK